MAALHVQMLYLNEIIIAKVAIDLKALHVQMLYLNFFIKTIGMLIGLALHVQMLYLNYFRELGELESLLLYMYKCCI